MQDGALMETRGMSSPRIELKAAKARLSDAAVACLENRPGAAEAADRARGEVTRIMAEQQAHRQDGHA